ncbi:MAG: hypothetical protein R3F05_04815 [Planctomycetota bacterium]
MRVHFALVAALALASCGADPLYVVEVRPTATGMERTVGFHDYPGSLDGIDPRQEALPTSLLELAPAGGDALAPHIRERLVAAYGEAGNDGKYRAAFGPRSPGVLDGFGILQHEDCPLGRIVSYAERFGGTEDVEAQRAGRDVALDALLGLLRPVWLEAVGDHPRRAKLVSWMDDHLRREMDAWLTIRAQVRASDAHSGSAAGQLARLGAFLAERGCATRPLDDSMLMFVRAFTRRELELRDDEPDPEGLQARGLEQAAGELLLNEHLPPEPPSLPGAATSYLELRSASEKPEKRLRQQYFRQYARLGALLDPENATASGGLTVCLFLRVPHPPVSTDGVYDPERKVITWLRHTLPAPAPSTRVHACWTEPDVAKQEALWGSVRLSNDALYRVVRSWSQLEAHVRPRALELLESLGVPRDEVADQLLENRLRRGIKNDEELAGLYSALAEGLYPKGD